MRAPLFFALVTLVLLVLPSCAVVPGEYSRPGFYAGASAILAVDDFDDIDPLDSNDDDTAAGFGIRGGYRFIPWLAAELAYERFDSFDVKTAEIDLQALSLQGKVYPLTGVFQPYGLLGIGFIDGEIDIESIGDSIDERDFHYRAGFGADIYLIKNLLLFVEAAYTWPEDDLEDLEFWTGSLGVQVRF